LATGDGDEADAGELRDFLGEDGVGEIFDLRQSSSESLVRDRVMMGASAGLTLE
jgi:hypothetical protein